MFPTETTIAYWTCPDCSGEQEIILVKNMELPPGLICDDCGHESQGEMDWEVEE